MFGGLAASGWHTASLTMRLMLESAMSGVSGRGLGVRINDITWSAPVRPGDELHAVSEVLELRPSRSKPDRGLVILKTTTATSEDQAVQEMTGTLLILRTRRGGRRRITPRRDPAPARPGMGSCGTRVTRSRSATQHR